MNGRVFSFSKAFLDIAAATLVAVASFAILLATSRDFGMVWDEGHTIRRERLLASWFSLVIDPPIGKTAAEAFSRWNLYRYWPFSREEPNGHPPFYALVGLAGWAPGRHLVDPLTAYRIGPMALCAIAAGALFHRLSKRFGPICGVLGTFTFLFMPRSFAHAHYAHYDMPMTSLWLLTQIAFLNCLESRRFIALFGVFAGLAAGTKFTGWFAVAPPIMWVLLFEAWPAIKAAVANKTRHPIPGVLALAWGLPIGALTLYAIQPPWWSDPIGGIQRFLNSNLTRDMTNPVPTLYWGHIYRFSLPWHNTIVLTAITTPALVIALGALGLVSSFSKRAWNDASKTTEARLWGLSWLVLMVVRALPAAPGHDGIRLFLPSIASLGVLSGLGAAWLYSLLKPRRVAWLAWALVVAASVESIYGIYSLYPYTLSYYNVPFGGLKAAESRGFELTYYWDTIGPEFLARMKQEAKTRKIELRFPSDLVNVQYLREWGDLPAEFKIVGLEIVANPDYVLQRRKGIYYSYDWWVDRNGKPWYRIARQGVDLLRVYSFAESNRAFEATFDQPVPDYLK